MEQPDLFTSGGAHARSHDPATSKAAAASLTVADLRTTQREVLQLYRRLGAMDDRAMIRAARDIGLTQSDSSLRSRRSELSKPNQERIAAMVDEAVAAYKARNDGVHPLDADLARFEAEARERLAIEGFRSPVYDTGRRVTYEGGRQGIVWDATENRRERAD